MLSKVIKRTKRAAETCHIAFLPKLNLDAMEFNAQPNRHNAKEL